MNKQNNKKTSKAQGAGQAKNQTPGGANQMTRTGVPAGGKHNKESFQKKLLICQKNYDYKDESKDVKGKTERLNAINEIQQYLQDQKTVVSLIIPHLDDVMTMIEKNIFRPLPNVKKSNLQMSDTGVEAEDEVDPAWPHLQGIYEFFL